MDRQRVILVVDDDASVLRSTSRLLIARGYAALEAANAAEALAKAAQTPPDAILMDLHMLPTNGLETARRLQVMDGLKNIPIIALSATPPDSETSQLFVQVLIKPSPSQQIVEAIEAALRQR